jgi:hypothetical protein
VERLADDEQCMGYESHHTYKGRALRSHLFSMNLTMAAVIVLPTVGAMTFQFATRHPISAIIILVVTRWDRKRIGGTRPYMLSPIHY